MTRSWALRQPGDRPAEGLPHRLGATWDSGGVDFALSSAHATRVEIWLFNQNDDLDTARVELPEYEVDPERGTAGAAF